MAQTENMRDDVPTESRRCDNPECKERVAWSGGRGRPQTFCDPNCRQRARYAAERLRGKIRSREKHVASASLTYRQRRDIDTELARLRWFLSAYPPALQRDAEN